MKRIFPLMVAVFAGLAAGWFLRGASQPPAEKGSRIPLAVDPAKMPSSAGSGTLMPWAGGATDTGSRTANHDPFTSLEEMITLMAGVGDFDFDELDMVELMAAVPRLLGTDLAATKRFLTELESAPQPQGESRALLGTALLTRWLLQEPEAAMAHAKSHPAIFGLHADEDTLQQLAMIGMAIAAKKNPASARTILEMLPEGDREDAGELLKAMEATRDPLKALNALTEDTLDEAEGILTHWSHRDPQAALAWVAARPEEEREDYYASIATGWAGKDPKAAMAWAASLLPESARADVYSEIASQITRGLPVSKAGEILAGLPQPVADRALLTMSQREYLNGGLSAEERTHAAAAVMEVLKRNQGDDSLQALASEAASDTARILAEQDPPAAAAWMHELPAGLALGSAAREVATAWAEKDPPAASEWVSSLPAGEAREYATAALIHGIKSSDPERALEWAKSLTTDERRTQEVNQVMRHWLPEDPVAAMRAFEALPPAMREEIWGNGEE